MWQALKRVIATLFSMHLDSSKADTGANPAMGELLELQPKSLVDPAKLEVLALHRTVLDWRDETHAELMRTAHALQEQVVKHVEAEFAGLTLFRKVIAEPANKVLSGWLTAEVVGPLEACLKREQDKLAAHAGQFAKAVPGDISFDVDAVDMTPTWLAAGDFKQGRKGQLVNGSRNWLLGPDGIAPRFCDQASDMAAKLMKVAAVC